MAFTRKHAPTFRDLTQRECVGMLARHYVGRLAYTFRDRVDVEPIGYAYVDRALVFRTSPGSKLETLAHHPWVALEIDEVEGPFDWRSVVVHGTMYILHETGSEAEMRAYRAAVKSLRRRVPRTLRAGDPVSFRSVVMKLHVDRMAGRAARSGTREVSPGRPPRSIMRRRPRAR
jgi:nitroimidazol reductase NimA-like FMN-containing flavoprotein (pyridoxamine 5'-phosphate oxidase superfamily)